MLTNYIIGVVILLFFVCAGLYYTWYNGEDISLGAVIFCCAYSLTSWFGIFCLFASVVLSTLINLIWNKGPVIKRRRKDSDDSDNDF